MAVVVAVDDNAILRQLLTVTLSMDSSISVKVFADGNEALFYANQNVVDVFVIDWHMPHYSGSLLLTKLRAIEKYEKTPIIILSGDDDTELKMEAKHLGATGWLVKPFNPNSLKILIRKLLGRYGDVLTISSPENHHVFSEKGFMIDFL